VTYTGFFNGMAWDDAKP